MSKVVDNFSKEKFSDLHFFLVMEKVLNCRKILLSNGLRELDQR